MPGTAPCGAPTCLFALLLLGGPAGAQDRSGPIEEISAPEVFAHLGRFRAGSDDGTIGNAPSYGWTVTVPFSRRFAADLDYQTGTVTRDTTHPEFAQSYTLTRLFVPSWLLAGTWARESL
jgi:hypothetical protein